VGVAGSAEFESTGDGRVGRTTLAELQCLLVDRFAGDPPVRLGSLAGGVAWTAPVGPLLGSVPRHDAPDHSQEVDLARGLSSGSRWPLPWLALRATHHVYRPNQIGIVGVLDLRDRIEQIHLTTPSIGTERLRPGRSDSSRARIEPRRIDGFAGQTEVTRTVMYRELLSLSSNGWPSLVLRAMQSPERLGPPEARVDHLTLTSSESRTACIWPSDHSSPAGGLGPGVCSVPMFLHPSGPPVQPSLPWEASSCAFAGRSRERLHQSFTTGATGGQRGRQAH